MGPTWHRLRAAGIAFLCIMAVGTAGYMAFGLGLVDALYQTVTTVATVGFQEMQEFSAGARLFTIGLILAGTGTALYLFTLFVELVVEGQLLAVFGRRRMDHRITTMKDHVIVCGFGRVGRIIARELVHAGREVVVIDRDESRLINAGHPSVLGDATADDVLQRAGMARAQSLVAALAADADNLFVTLSGRAQRPELFIVARARDVTSISKLERAGADRVVNPQELGAQRMASFIVRPAVVDFVDVHMHDRTHDLELEEVPVGAGSTVVGRSLQSLNLRESTGAMVVAVQDGEQTFVTNPDPDTVLRPGMVLIAIGADSGLRRLAELVAPPARR